MPAKPSAAPCPTSPASASNRPTASCTSMRPPAGTWKSSAIAHGDDRATLVGVMDSTITPMGGRLLRRWLVNPVRDLERLGSRHRTRRGPAQSGPAQPLREQLCVAPATWSASSRGSALGSSRPRDLSTLRSTLACLPDLHEQLEAAGSTSLQTLRRIHSAVSRCARVVAARRWWRSHRCCCAVAA